MSSTDKAWVEFNQIRDEVGDYLQADPLGDKDKLLGRRERARKIVSEGVYLDHKQRAGLNFEIDAFICTNRERDYADWMRFMMDGRNSRLDFMDPTTGALIDATSNIKYKPSKYTRPHKRLHYMFRYSNTVDEYCMIEYVSDACLREFRSLERSKPKLPFLWRISDNTTSEDLADFIRESEDFLNKLNEKRVCLPENFNKIFVEPLAEGLSKSKDRASDALKYRENQEIKSKIGLLHETANRIAERNTCADYVDFYELKHEQAIVKNQYDNASFDDEDDCEIEEYMLEINDAIDQIFSDMARGVVFNAEQQWRGQLNSHGDGKSREFAYDENLNTKIEEFIKDGHFTYDGFNAKHVVYYCHSLRVTHNMSMDIEEEFKILMSRVLEYHGKVVYQSDWFDSGEIVYRDGGNEVWKQTVYSDFDEDAAEIHYAEFIEIFDQKNTDIEKIYSTDFKVSPEEFQTLGYATTEGEGYGYDTTDVDYIDRYWQNLDDAMAVIEMSFFEERIGRFD